MKNMVIEIPDGYVVDKDKSTDTRIVFKKEKSIEPFRSNPDALIDGYYIDKNSIMLAISPIAYAKNTPINWNVFVTKAQAKSALAMAQISQIMKNDPRFGGAITNEEWNNKKMKKYVIYRSLNSVNCCVVYREYHFLAFHTYEQRKLFLKENMDLVKTIFND